MYSTAEGGDVQYDCGVSLGDIGRFDGDFCGSTTAGGMPGMLSGGNDYFHRQPAVQGRQVIIGRRLPNLPSAYRSNSNVGGVYPCHYEPTNCSSTNFPIHQVQVQHPPPALRSVSQIDSDDGSVDHVYESPTLPVAAGDRLMTSFSGQPEMKTPDVSTFGNVENVNYFDQVTAGR
ncbi:MAG: hypothetical protein MUE72_08400 [Chitinophagaceae bacterium]|nr:hypothetical protein [Chitinophagaceae bacterium]